MNYDDTGMSPGKIAASVAGVLLLVAAVIIGIGLIGVGSYKLHWFVAERNANHETQIQQHGVGNQSALREDISRRITQVHERFGALQHDTNAQERGADKATLMGYARQACDDAEQIDTPLPQDEKAWVTRYCLTGSVKVGVIPK